MINMIELLFLMKTLRYNNYLICKNKLVISVFYN